MVALKIHRKMLLVPGKSWCKEAVMVPVDPTKMQDPKDLLTRK